METSDVLLMIALGSASLGAAVLFWAVRGYLHERIRFQGVQKRAGTGTLASRALRNGVPAMRSVAEFFMRVPTIRTSVERIVAVLSMRGIACDVQAIGSLLSSVAVCLLLLGFIMGSWVAGVAFAACAFAGASAWASHTFEQRRDGIREALPDAVRAMSACFHAGYTLQQTFGQLQRELKGPVGELFGSACDAMETGSTAKEALASLRGSSTVPELSFISVALEVQHRAGGSMRHVLEAACDSLESELELRRSLRVHTAQARLSARVVTGVSLGLVGVLSLLTEDFLGPFFDSTLGMAMLAAAVSMQCAGVLVVRKMLRVEVD
ncbi:MAG: type II secretion system F family protein [Eggerthellaceae bacterium]|nr:type II secretion system F family protein [Eggerthellaceae bacterium]